MTSQKTRIDRRFEALRNEGRPALVTFTTAGDPDLATSEEILRGLSGAGADVIELGMPFSDPMADGPAIQAASQRALANGQTLAKTLEMVKRFRTDDDETPIVLMGYYNPIYHMGVDTFLDTAVAAGVDGLIIVDLPPETDEELCLPALTRGLNFIRLATPTTDDKRLPAVLRNTSGFVYYVSLMGITSAGSKRIPTCLSRLASACGHLSRRAQSGRSATVSSSGPRLSIGSPRASDRTARLTRKFPHACSRLSATSLMLSVVDRRFTANIWFRPPLMAYGNAVRRLQRWYHAVRAPISR